MTDLTGYDFTKSRRDYKFTQRSVQNMNRIVSSDMFKTMSAEAIFSYLCQTMEIVSFGDYLKRYIYVHANIEQPFRAVADVIYEDILSYALRENRVPHTFSSARVSRRQAAHKWLNAPCIERKTLFMIAFALHMSVADVSEFLTKVLKESDFHYDDPEETVYWYCYYVDKSYAYARSILETVDAQPDGARAAHIGFDHDVPCIRNEEQLLAYLRQLRGSHDVPSSSERALREFQALLERTRALVAAQMHKEDAACLCDCPDKASGLDEISLADIERALYCGVPINKNRNLEKMSRSLLSEHFRCKRLSRQRIRNILSGKYEVNRFDLITLLFFIFSHEQEHEKPEVRYAHFIDETNRVLLRCKMHELYPVNPFESFVLMCMLTDAPYEVYAEVWEKSYQQD